MDIKNSLKKAICSLFEVHVDSENLQRIITPLEYPGTNDRIVVRVRSNKNGFDIDENGETGFIASLNGGDIESDIVDRWVDQVSLLSPVSFDEDEVISIHTNDEKLVAPYIFRVAEAAQQLYAISTSKVERQPSDFKDQVKAIVQSVATELNIGHKTDVELPIAGGLIADHVLDTDTPLIIITATSSTRLLEAEVIYMQYRADSNPGTVIAVAESQQSVGKKQYERANYYTDKTVIFDNNAFGKLIQTMH